MKIGNWKLKIVGEAGRGASFRLLGLLALLVVASVPGVSAQVPCTSDRLDAASGMYDFGRFEQTFGLLGPCLPDGFAQRAERVQAYRLMALANIGVDSLARAREWVRILLRANSRFRPDPLVDPPRFTDMVDDLRPRWYSWLWRGNEWYKWAGRGAVVAGVASVPFLLRDKPKPDLPGPPVLPLQ